MAASDDSNGITPLGKGYESKEFTHKHPDIDDYTVKTKDSAKFQVGDWVRCGVENSTDFIHGIISKIPGGAEGKNVPNTFNMDIPGWDSLAGKPDSTGKPQGGHIYNVRPAAIAVPQKEFRHAEIPEYINVDTSHSKGDRINGDYKLSGTHEGRPVWEMTCADNTVLCLCFKKQKRKPAWLISRKEIVEGGKDGGYALFAQDIWLPTHFRNHLRSEVWGIWDKPSGQWKADQNLKITPGKGKKTQAYFDACSGATPSVGEDPNPN